MKKLGENALIDASADVRDCALAHYTEVGARTKLLEVSLADYSYVVNDSDIAYAKIGRFCSIASHVRINPGDHPMHRASQSHFTYRASAYFEGEANDYDFFQWRRNRTVTIGHDVWIGHGVIVLAGRSIGTGAVVGGGSVVTKDVPDYSIVVGNPARIVRQRFEADIAEGLRALSWWDWPHDVLQRALPDFQQLSVDAFVSKYTR